MQSSWAYLWVQKRKIKGILVGGFKLIEKYESNWIISPGKGENKKCLKPPPRILLNLGIYLEIQNPTTTFCQLKPLQEAMNWWLEGEGQTYGGKKTPDFCKAPAACNPAKLFAKCLQWQEPLRSNQAFYFFCHVYILLMEEMRLTTWDV